MRTIVGTILLGLVPPLLAWGAWAPPATAAPTPVRAIAVTGSGVEMFPAFDAGVARYAVTTDATTSGSVLVTASTSDPAGTVLVDGAPSSGPTPVTGLDAGDEVSVIITDSAGTTAYSVMYLPTGFPRIDVTTRTGAEQPGLVALTLNTFEQVAPPPAYDTIIDRNGVPVYAVAASLQDLDLKQQPNGEITVARPTTSPDHTGVDIVTLDEQLEESAVRTRVQGGLVNTDPHDAQRLADGSTLLLGYEPNAVTGKLDATIQRLDPAGDPVFTWSSEDLADETVVGSNPDYAHVNSVEQVSDGDVLVSFRHFSSVMRIATTAHDGYQPGDVVWKLGGRDSSFTFVDDPYGGPCAQHTASMLPNGHVLLFDNGSSGLCVDPADPTGPTLDRGQTRVAEYALDLQAGTATLVWDHTPTGRYALFAGSSKRLENGNTLIGWAADHTELTSEVDADGDVVWAASAGPPVPGHQKYITYRAAFIAAIPDRIAPEVHPTGPGDGAVLVAGSDVGVGAARCTDRGGSNLTTCTTTGAPGGRLDTATAGSRTWSVTATDGAGNTTTETRSYVVRAARRQADGMLQRPGATWWLGRGVVGAPTDQTLVRAARRGTRVTSYWRVANAGERADQFRLGGTGGTRAFSVRYYSLGREVTRAVLAGTFRTASLSPGRTQVVRVVIVPRKVRSAPSTRTFFLRATAAGVPTAPDRVAITIRVRR